MCVAFIGEKHLGDGWGCCRCRTYNGLHRDACKFCGVAHCPIGRAEDPDILEPRDEVN